MKKNRLNEIRELTEKKHQNWIVNKSFGFGNFNETKLINISKNSVSSSILEINKKLTSLGLKEDKVSKEQDHVKKLYGQIDGKKSGLIFLK